MDAAAYLSGERISRFAEFDVLQVEPTEHARLVYRAELMRCLEAGRVIYGLYYRFFKAMLTGHVVYVYIPRGSDYQLTYDQLIVPVKLLYPYLHRIRFVTLPPPWFSNLEEVEI